jgi:uncharacterized protein
MKYNWFETSSPFAKLLLTLILMLFFLLISLYIAAFFAVPFTHRSLSSIFGALSEIHNPANLNLIRYFQVVQSITFFLLPAIIVSYLFGSVPGEYLSLRKRPAIILLILSVSLIIVIIPLINYLEEMNSRLQLPVFLKGLENWIKTSESTANTLSELFLKVNTTGGLLFNLFMMAILPALSEEFLFRGVFQRLFSEMFKNYHWGIIFSAALFSAIHFQFYGFVPRMLLGMVFGYMLVWSGTLWVPVIAHFMNNAVGILFYFLLSKGIVNNSLDTIGAGKQEIQISMISLFLSGALLYLFYFVSKRQNEKGILN